MSAPFFTSARRSFFMNSITSLTTLMGSAISSEMEDLARKFHHESHGEPGVLHVLGGFGQRRDPDLAWFLSQGRIRSHVSLPQVGFGCRSPREEPASSYLPARGRTARGPRAVSPGGQEGTACPVFRVGHGPRVPQIGRA